MITRTMGAAALLALAIPMAQAGEAVGYNQIVVPASSDVLLTVPFNQNSKGAFTVTGKDATSVTVSETFDDGQYDGVYFVRFVSGGSEGLWSTITSTSANSLELANTDVLDHVSVDDGFRIYPHHTINSLFPENMLGMSHQDGTAILLFENDLDNMQQNKSSIGTTTYFDALGQWFGSFDGTAVIEPETKFVIRNNNDAEDLVFTAFGNVPDYNVSRIIAANGDLDIGTGYPVPVVLKNAGLAADNRTVVIVDNTATGMNKSGSSATYFEALGEWFGAEINGDTQIGPSTAFKLRLQTDDSGMLTIQKPY